MLVQRLYDALSPGGLLIIGNMNETALSNLWPMSYIADQDAQYRGEAEMSAWALGLARLNTGRKPNAPSASGCCSSAKP